MTKYIAMRPVQEPFSLGLDTNGRAMVAFNLLGHCEPTREFLDEAAQVLLDAGVGTLNDDIFIGPSPFLPPTTAPVLSLIPTGGAPPEYTQDVDGGPAYKRPGLQVLVRAKGYRDADTMANDAYDAFCGVTNEEITVAGNGPLHRRLYATTTNATETELFRDGTGGTLRVQIPEGVAAKYIVQISANRTSGAHEVAGYELRGMISNDAGTVALDGPPSLETDWETDPGWSVEVEADDVNDALAIKVVGAAGASINWQADVYLQRSYG